MFRRWPKRDPNKYYYLVPNEVFNLGLSSHEIAVYNYLLRCEDRRTYQCHPSYRTIGKAVQLSENTVRKYVAGLVCAVAGLAVFGADNMVIPAMVLTLAVLLLGRRKLCA